MANYFLESFVKSANPISRKTDKEKMRTSSGITYKERFGEEPPDDVISLTYKDPITDGGFGNDMGGQEKNANWFFQSFFKFATEDSVQTEVMNKWFKGHKKVKLDNRMMPKQPLPEVSNDFQEEYNEEMSPNSMPAVNHG